MPRYFTFSDDTSHKFWQIDTHDTTLTVTFGRIGTAGQTQTKSFDSADRTQQEADKLIREKTRKGYVEQPPNGTITSPASVSTQTPRPKLNDAQALEAILNRYDEIVQIASLKNAPFPFEPNLTRDQYQHQVFKKLLSEMLLPLIKSLDKQYYASFAEKIRRAKKHWCESVAVGSEEYGDGSEFTYGNGLTAVRYSGFQRDLINYSAIGFISVKYGNDFNFHNILTGEYWDEYVFPVLCLTRPAWLPDNFSPNRKNAFPIRSYKWLRALEQEGLIDYEPSVYATYLTSYGYDAKKEADRQTHIDYVTSDSIILNRDIPSLFDYETSIHQVFEWGAGEDGRSERIQFWPLVFSRLLAEGKLDRLWFFDKCLSVQTKDWKADLRAFYRKQIEANNPTTAEWMALQPSLFPLLAAQHPHVVNWAAGVVKTIHTEPDVNVAELLDWAASVMGRDDCKTAVKTLLPVLERLLKTQPKPRPTVALLLADCFALNDLTLQTKAATLLSKYADPADTALQERLHTYTGQMLGNVAKNLQGLQDLTGLEETAALEDGTGLITYQYAPPKPVQRLVPGQEVRLPETWNEFMFLIGKFITSDDPLDMEILMNALILQPKDRPDDWREQLRVYEKRLRNEASGAARSYTFSYLRHYFFGQQEPEFLDEQYLIKLLLHRLQIYRLRQLARKQKSGSQLPFLSLPTHVPFWISPKVLVERLLLYQQANEPIDPLDLVIALSRMPRERVEEATPVLSSLRGNILQLLNYCTGLAGDIELPKVKGLNRLLSFFDNNNSSSLFQGVWATMARTLNPDETFSQFKKTSLAVYPNVVEPYVPTIEVGQDKLERFNDYTKKMQVIHSWTGLKIKLPTLKDAPITLLHSTDLHVDNYAFAWDCRELTQFDFLFSQSLTPQFTDALFVFVAKYGCAESDVSISVTNALHLMLQPGFQFRQMSMLVLACGLLAKKRETAALAAEVVIHHVSEQTLDVAQLGARLGWLLVGNYAPVQRLTDALALVKDVSPLHNKALLLTLDALFVQFTAVGDVPKNTKKLLELYLDLLVRLAEPPAEATALALRNWQNMNAVKGICKDILKQS